MGPLTAATTTSVTAAPATPPSAWTAGASPTEAPRTVTLIVQPMLYGGRAGHWGQAPAVGSITVLRDGEPIATEPSTEFLATDVPPEPAAYRVEVEAAREGPAALSRQVSLAWEFESGHVDDETLLPVSVVRFTPNLGPDHTAPAARPLLVPVRVKSAPGAGSLASLAVQVSFDDGETWQSALMVGGRHVLARHPEGDGFVSLRATAADTAGNTVEQTIIRAYAYG